MSQPHYKWEGTECPGQVKAQEDAKPAFLRPLSTASIPGLESCHLSPTPPSLKTLETPQEKPTGGQGQTEDVVPLPLFRDKVEV